MTWLCRPQPVNEWLFHLPKQVWETPGDVMIGGATTATIRRASQLVAHRPPTPDIQCSSTTLAWLPTNATHTVIVGHCDVYGFIYVHACCAHCSRGRHSVCGIKSVIFPLPCIGQHLMCSNCRKDKRDE